ncbi:Protein of unknown function [Bacillus mycoides]|nr:Protein of unknown function [Bacillus mycoides]
MAVPTLFIAGGTAFLFA